MSLHQKALILRDGARDQAGLASSLETVAGLDVDQGQAELAVRLFGAAQSLRDAKDYARPPQEYSSYEADLAQARSGRPAKLFERAWSEGATLAPEEAASTPPSAAASGGGPSTGAASRTPMESDVVAARRRRPNQRRDWPAPLHRPEHREEPPRPRVRQARPLLAKRVERKRQ